MTLHGQEVGNLFLAPFNLVDSTRLSTTTNADRTKRTKSDTPSLVHRCQSGGAGPNLVRTTQVTQPRGDVNGVAVAVASNNFNLTTRDTNAHRHLETGGGAHDSFVMNSLQFYNSVDRGLGVRKHGENAISERLDNASPAALTLTRNPSSYLGNGFCGTDVSQ